MSRRKKSKLLAPPLESSDGNSLDSVLEPRSPANFKGDPEKIAFDELAGAVSVEIIKHLQRTLWEARIVLGKRRGEDAMTKAVELHRALDKLTDSALPDHLLPQVEKIKSIVESIGARLTKLLTPE
jgi:hypothetical protein